MSLILSENACYGTDINQGLKLLQKSYHFFFQRRKHAAIEYDNKLLLERLATIVQTKSVDNQIQQSTAIHATFKVEMLRHKKRLEIQRITTENQRILRRLQEVPPAYNHVEWDEHARINEKNKRSMALYPEYYVKSEKNISKSAASVSPPPCIQSNSEKTFKSTAPKTYCQSSNSASEKTYKSSALAPTKINSQSSEGVVTKSSRATPLRVNFQTSEDATNPTANNLGNTAGILSQLLDRATIFSKVNDKSEKFRLPSIS